MRSEKCSQNLSLSILMRVIRNLPVAVDLASEIAAFDFDFSVDTDAAVADDDVDIDVPVDDNDDTDVHSDYSVDTDKGLAQM